MSVYATGMLSEQNMRRPLRFLSRSRTAGAAQVDAVVSPQRRRHPSPETTRAVVHRHHVNPISVSCIQALVESTHKDNTVLGVAVLKVDDITPEERVDAATYFEAVGPDGAPWMESLVPPPPPPRCSCDDETRPTVRKTSRATSRDMLSLREVSHQHVDDDDGGGCRGANGIPEAVVKHKWPAFASCGAAKVARPRAKKARSAPRRAVAVAPPTTTAASRQPVRHQPRAPATHPTREGRRHPSHPSQQLPACVYCAPVAEISASRPNTGAGGATHRSGESGKGRKDEAAIVFSDVCMAALPDSAVTAFASAFQAGSRGVVVKTVLPHPGNPRTALTRTVAPSRGHHNRGTSSSSSAVMSAIAAHALFVVNAASATNHGPLRSTLDQAVVLRADVAEEHIQRYAHEAKMCQRPRFRRRTSVEVYGSGYYTTTQ
jgi:hypothetical protein